MANDTLLTWADVKRRLDPLGRGAPYRLAQRLGMNSSFFYRKLGSHTALTAAQAAGAAAFFEGADDDEPDAPEAPAPGAPRRLPVYGYAAMGGDDLIALNDGQVVEWMELPMGLEVGPGDWFVVKGIGSSMEPRIFAGEPLLIRRRHPPTRGRDVLVEFTDGSGVIKTYHGQRDGRVFVEQWNERRLLDYDATRVKALHGGVIKL